MPIIDKKKQRQNNKITNLNNKNNKNKIQNFLRSKSPQKINVYIFQPRFVSLLFASTRIENRERDGFKIIRSCVVYFMFIFSGVRMQQIEQSFYSLLNRRAFCWVLDFVPLNSDFTTIHVYYSLY